jgi:hypothetical protein
MDDDGTKARPHSLMTDVISNTSRKCSCSCSLSLVYVLVVRCLVSCHANTTSLEHIAPGNRRNELPAAALHVLVALSAAQISRSTQNHLPWLQNTQHLQIYQNADATERRSMAACMSTTSEGQRTLSGVSMHPPVRNSGHIHGLLAKLPSLQHSRLGSQPCTAKRQLQKNAGAGATKNWNQCAALDTFMNKMDTVMPLVS